MLGLPRLRHRRARARPPTSAAAALAAVHHLLLGHGLAVAGAARGGRPRPQVGITLNLHAGPTPADDSRGRPTPRPTGSTGCGNRLFLDPLLARRLPRATWSTTLAPGHRLRLRRRTATSSVDRARRSTSSASTTTPGRGRGAGAADARRRPTCRGHAATRARVTAGVPRTAMGWAIDPDGLRRAARCACTATTRTSPLFITENGAASRRRRDRATATVHDADRIDYLDAHLRAVRRGDRRRRRRCAATSSGR